MTTLGQLQDRVLRLLDDPEGKAYPDEMQLQAIGSALMAVLPWLPKPSTDIFTGDGSLTEFPFPTDLYEVQAVIAQASGEILPRAVFHPGGYHGSVVDTTNDWIEYPAGSITFSKALDSNDIYELWYSAYWDAPLDMDDDSYVLEPPDVLVTGIAYYAASYLLMPGAVGAAEIRQFNINVDSGNPEHNPVRDAVSYLLNMFQQEMKRIPAFQRSQR